MAVIDRVRELILPLVGDVGAELYDIEFTGGVLRVLVDQPGGIDVGTIQRLARAIGRTLDDADPVPGRYTLEVSSPGLERPLRTRSHFERAVGAQIKVKTVAPIDGARRFAGTVVGADDNGFVLDVDGTTRSFSYDDLGAARTVFEWGPTPKPGGKKPATGGHPDPTDRPEKEAKA